MRFVVEQARAFTEAEGGSLRDFLQWADLQGSEGARVVETVLPETDDDAVRILTIHGAKGLEFPITIVSGMTTKAQSRHAAESSCGSPTTRDTYALRVSARVTTEEFERYRPIDEQMDFHEKLRLLYVAMTRARDHLVVSVHRPAKVPNPEDRTGWTHAQLIWQAAEPSEGWVPLTPAPARRPLAAAGAGAGRRTHSATAHVGRLARNPRPRARRRRPPTRRAPPPASPGRQPAREAAARRATEPGRDPGLAKDARDLELPPWNKGRYGTAIGRRRARGPADGRPRHRRRASTPPPPRRPRPRGSSAGSTTSRRWPRSALTTRTVHDAVAAGFRREMYVAAPVGWL